MSDKDNPCITLTLSSTTLSCEYFEISLSYPSISLLTSPNLTISKSHLLLPPYKASLPVASTPQCSKIECGQCWQQGSGSSFTFSDKGQAIEKKDGKVVYLGPIEDGRLSGFGLREGVFGLWRDSRLEGPARKKGEVAEWKNGMLHGVAKIESPNSIRFLGEVQEGKRNGFGRELAEQYCVSGMWKNDSLHGLCLWEDLQNEDFYFGEYVKGEKQGIGILKRNGSTYKGNFYKNEIHGLGLIEEAEGKLRAQIFAKGIPIADAKNNSILNTLLKKVNSLNIVQYNKAANERIKRIEDRVIAIEEILSLQYSQLRIDFEDDINEFNLRKSIYLQAISSEINFKLGMLHSIINSIDQNHLEKYQTLIPVFKFMRDYKEFFSMSKIYEIFQVPIDKTDTLYNENFPQFFEVKILDLDGEKEENRIKASLNLQVAENELKEALNKEFSQISLIRSKLEEISAISLEEASINESITLLNQSSYHSDCSNNKSSKQREKENEEAFNLDRSMRSINPSLKSRTQNNLQGCEPEPENLPDDLNHSILVERIEVLRTHLKDTVDKIANSNRQLVEDKYTFNCLQEDISEMEIQLKYLGDRRDSLLEKERKLDLVNSVRARCQKALTKLFIPNILKIKERKLFSHEFDKILLKHAFKYKDLEDSLNQLSEKTQNVELSSILYNLTKENIIKNLQYIVNEKEKLLQKLNELKDQSILSNDSLKRLLNEKKKLLMEVKSNLRGLETSRNPMLSSMLISSEKLYFEKAKLKAQLSDIIVRKEKKISAIDKLKSFVIPIQKSNISQSGNKVVSEFLKCFRPKIQNEIDVDLLEEPEKMAHFLELIKFTQSKMNSLQNEEEEINRLKNIVLDEDERFKSSLKKVKRLSTSLSPSNPIKHRRRGTSLANNKNFKNDEQLKQQIILLNHKNVLLDRLSSLRNKVDEKRKRILDNGLDTSIISLEAENLMEETKRKVFKKFKDCTMVDKMKPALKIDIAYSGTLLFAFGSLKNSLQMFSIQDPSKIKKLKSTNITLGTLGGIKSSYNSHLIVNNKDTGELEIYNGKFEIVKTLQAYTPSKHSLNIESQFLTESRCTGLIGQFLWCRGNHCLTILNLSGKFRESDILDFWKDENSEFYITPLFIVANNKCTRILGFGMRNRKSNSQPMLVYCELTPDERKIVGQKVCLKIKDIQNINEEIHCGEVSYNQRYVYLAGSKGAWASISVVKFNPSLEVIHHESITVHDYQTITSLKRLPGGDIILAGAYASILILQFERRSKFTLIGAYEVCSYFISDIAIAEDRLYFIEKNSQKVGSLSFNESFDLKKMYKKEMEKSYIKLKKNLKQITSKLINLSKFKHK